MMKRKRTPIMHYHQCTVAKVSRYQKHNNSLDETARAVVVWASLLRGGGRLFARSTEDGELGHDIEIV